MAPASQPAASLRQVRAHRSSSMLVGRDQDLRRLQRTFSAAAVDGAACLVLGEPGIGKTRLVTELRSELELPTAGFLVGGCPPVPALATPYAPFTMAFRTVVREQGVAWFHRLLGADARHLAPIVPRLGRGAAPEAAQAEVRTELIEALHELLEAAAAEAPLVLAIEDVHWATDSTLAVLASLLEEVPVGVLLVITGREEALQPAAAALIGEASRSANREVLRLQSLTLEDVARQVGQIMGRPLDAAEVRAIHRRSGGIPFLVEEALLAPAAASPGATLHLRIAGLPESAARVARLAAIHAEPIPAEVLERATDLGPAAIRAAIAACQGAGLLVSGEGSRATYRMRHALLHDAVAQTIPPVDRSELHARLAAALEAVGLRDASDVSRAARHWLEAGRPREALPLLVRAADEAARAGGLAEALTALEQARRAVQSLPPGAVPPVSEATIVGRIAGTLAVRGEFEAADGRFADAIALSRDEEERLHLAGIRAQWLWAAGDEREASPIRREIAELGIRRGSRIRSLDLLGAVIRAMVGESRFEAAEPMATVALDRARRAGRTDIEASALAALGLLYGFTRRIDDGARHLRLAGDLAAANGHHDELQLAAGNHVGLLVDAERRAEVPAAIDHWLSVGRRLGNRMLQRTMELAILDELLTTGRWADAESRLAELEQRPDLDRATQLRVGLSRAQIAIARGQLAAADAALATTASGATGAQQAHHTGPLHYWHARRALAAGELGAAAAWVRGGLEALAAAVEDGRWYELWVLGLRIERHAAAVDPRTARARAAALIRLEHRRRRQADRLNVNAVAVLRREARAEVAALRGRRTSDEWAGIAERWERLQRPFPAAEAWAEAARASVAAGDADAGRRAVRRGRPIAEALGMRNLIVELDGLLERSDRRRHGVVKLGDGQTLTEREREVLVQIARGRTNREIAADLVIGEKTAATHVSNVLGKLGVTRRTEAAVAALRLGLVRPAENEREPVGTAK
jgi:DNA-binding CsgD family transcriptional regulator